MLGSNECYEQKENRLKCVEECGCGIYTTQSREVAQTRDPWQ